MAEPEVSFNDPTRDEINEETGGKRTYSVHFNYNDSMGLKLDSGRLVGRTDPQRGFAQHIEVDAPLTFEDKHLGIDLSAIEESISDLEATVANHETRIDALETSTGLATETAAREAADTALDARVDIFEGTRPPVVLTATNLAGLGTPTGLPAGRTVLGFARDSNRLYIWDPDGSTWVTPTWT